MDGAHYFYVFYYRFECRSNVTIDQNHNTQNVAGTRSFSKPKSISEESKLEKVLNKFLVVAQHYPFFYSLYIHYTYTNRALVS